MHQEPKEISPLATGDSEKPKKKGDCFFVALQMIQDYSTEFDMIEKRVRAHDIDPACLDFGKLFLVHGMAKMADGRKKSHGWIELDDWAIDYSNGNASVEPKLEYRTRNEIIDPKLFDRDTVLAILMSKPPSPYWANYSQDDLDQIRRRFGISKNSWKRIDFLDAFHNNRDPF